MELTAEDIVVHRDAIARRVEELAQRISADFAPTSASDPGAELTIVPVLTGAFVFAADLIRRLPLKTRIELVAVSSYPGTATRSQGPRLLNQLPDLENRHV
ncbi:MAG: phosphoribosyltransferase family protein, partial [Phycisphaeraceae bacterium]|nr:phosphoribosyltransferase family protein [Phycisphaeraceae bacterium]